MSEARAIGERADWERHTFRFVHQRWFHVWLLTAGITVALLISYDVVENATLIPGMMLFGALSGSMAFAIFISDRLDLRGVVPFETVAATVLYGGAIGIFFGGLLDMLIIDDPTSLKIFWVGPIEETAKLVLPVAIWLSGRHRSPRAGLVLGLASAAGFAVLESMGYGYNALTTADGTLDHAALVPVQRGMMAPFGHLAWTGTATIVLWTEWQRRDRFTVNARVLGVLFTVMALHSINDFVSFQAPATKALVLATPFISIGSYLIFKFHARELTPPGHAGNVPPGWRRHRDHSDADTSV